MKEPILEIKDLSKKFRLRHEKQRYLSFRDSIGSLFSFKGSEAEEFWALKNINLEIHQGEAVGLIGKNGAGKSTLLKILSRITPPTTGKIISRGRISSLLEVGTGFHQELTGRENIFLNGSILGMKRRDIQENFDEIVDFAGTEKFLDIPLKRYSTGMKLRLAFSVAAFLNPDILIIDEVLAVGDSEFQKKCLGKIQHDMSKGRTILFVSHNMGAVNSLCSRCVYLKNGEVAAIGESKNVISQYLIESGSGKNRLEWEKDHPGDNFVKLHSFALKLIDKTEAGVISVTDAFYIQTQFEVLREGARPVPEITISTQQREIIFKSIAVEVKELKSGIYTAKCFFPANFLNQENYILSVSISSQNPYQQHVHEDLFFEVLDDNQAPTRADYKGQMPGMIRPLLNWEIQTEHDN